MPSDAQFWLALLQIIGVNIILSGDNAVVIALACRGLPERQQKLGIAIGATAAVVWQIVLTVFIVYLLTIPYLNLVGGLALLWIGYSLMTPDEGDANVDSAGSLLAAVRIVVIADLVMSLDNVMAVAAAAHGDIVLLVLGLLISVPLVVYGATLLIALIKRFPVIVPGGAALIGYVGGEIAVGDPAVAPWVAAHVPWLPDALPLATSVAVVLVGGCRAKLGATNEAAKEEATVTTIAVPAGMLAAQALSRLLVFLASLLGYGANVATGGWRLSEQWLTVLHAAKPLLAAVIAVLVGEMAVRLLERMRRSPA